MTESKGYFTLCMFLEEEKKFWFDFEHQAQPIRSSWCFARGEKKIKKKRRQQQKYYLLLLLLVLLFLY